MLIRVLVAADSQALRRRLIRLLDPEPVAFVPASGTRRLIEHLHRQDIDLVLVSRSRLPEPAEETVRSVRELPERPEVVVISEREDPEERARFLAAGCLAVVHQPLPDAAIRDTFRALLARLQEESTRRLRAEQPEQRSSLSDFVSDSPAMTTFLEVVRRVVSSHSSVLILGETGVGKERLARALHVEGPRAPGPFVAINCGALSESLLESELFGHEEGAFTGATRARRGFFELAHRGTLFLDEVGEMPAHLQIKLLRALQDRQILRVGGERPVPVDARVIAATNRVLEDEVEQKRFRADLYYRLAVVTLTIPPLRERREDIPGLVTNYLEYFRFHMNRPVRSVSPEALEALRSYDWPGNVRELINVLERAVLLCPGTEVRLEDLPGAVAGNTRGVGPIATPGLDEAGPDWLGRPLKQVRREVLEAVERRYLTALLEATAGRVGKAARRAAIDERSLYNLMRRYDLRKEDFRPAD